MPVAKKKQELRDDKINPPAKVSKHRLSKSRFCTGVQCLKALYLQVHEPDLADEIDPAQQMIFDQGTEVGAEARKCYPGGILIDFDYLHSQDAIKATQEAIAKVPPAIFEAAFFFHNTLVRIDVLKNNGDGTWDIIEVKSTTSFKDEHIQDIAIQRYVAEGAGVKVSQVFLKHLNRDCVFPKLDNLFADVSCTDQVAKELETVPDRIQQMLSILEADREPKTEIGPHCDSPYECNFKAKCWAHIPKHSVFELNGVWDKTKFELYKRGILRIQDIPESEKVSRSKPQQLKAVRSNSPVIDANGLRDFLNALEYPIYFFDFETINPAIPKFSGLRPYSQVPFQYSCHIAESETGEITHIEYLADGSKDPRNEVAERLISDLGTSGTILAYNQSFEKTRIEELARQVSLHSDALLELLPRFIDLKDAFSKYFYHPDFHGSFSIKDVLPVLVPAMTYEGMDVSDGGGAQVAYLKLGDPTISTEERNTYRKHLLEYCRQDTLAMVELLMQLKVIAKQKG